MNVGFCLCLPCHDYFVPANFLRKRWMISNADIGCHQADDRGDQDPIDQLDVVGQERALAIGAEVTGRDRSEVGLGSRMALLAGAQQVGRRDGRARIAGFVDGVAAVAVAADRFVAPHRGIVGAVVVDGQAVVIGAVRGVHIGGDVVLAHQLLIVVAAGAAGGNVQAEGGGPDFAALGVVVAVGAAGSIGVAGEVGAAVNRLLPVLVFLGISRGPLFVHLPAESGSVSSGAEETISRRRRRGLVGPGPSRRSGPSGGGSGGEQQKNAKTNRDRSLHNSAYRVATETLSVPILQRGSARERTTGLSLG